MTNRNNIGTKYLRSFLAVAEEGGFEAAGRRLGFSQGAVSTHVKRLEDCMAATLFERGRRGCRTQLTPAGHKLLPDAEVMLALHDRIVRRARARGGKLW